jgi:dipeptidyl aminopeptidase/acylaminoacyl peptidase
MGVSQTSPHRPSARRRRLAIGWTILLAGLAWLYLLMGAVVYDRLARVSDGCAGAPAETSPAYFAWDDLDTRPYLMPDYEEVTFASRDPRITVSGWYVPSVSDPGGPAVVVVHGLYGCKRQAGVLTAAGMLHRHGFSVLLIDLRDHGGSTIEDGRHAGGTDEYQDVLGAWDWLQARGHPAERIGLYGQSLGAATVLIASGAEPHVAATWEDSSYGSIDEAISDELTRGGYPTFLAPAGVLAARLLAGDDLLSPNTLDAARKLGGRALFVTHGDADQRLSVRFASQIAAAARAAGSQVEPWIIKGADHVQGIRLESAEYERRLVDFFRRALGDPLAAVPQTRVSQLA